MAEWDKGSKEKVEFGAKGAASKMPVAVILTACGDSQNASSVT